MFFFFKQKTAYEMRISDWSSDVCSSDLAMLLGQSIHARPCREVVGILRAAMKHDKQRAFARMRPAMRNIELVDATSGGARSEERRVGKECVSTCRSRWSPYRLKKKNRHHMFIGMSVKLQKCCEKN